MSTLVVHPRDSSTFFLKKIYDPISNKTVITGGITKSVLRKLIENHDKVLMLGHGSPYGLLSVGQFPDVEPYIIDYSFVELLSRKAGNVFIWCNADLFVKQGQLTGLYSGMFISEIEEALYFDFWDVETNEIERSNDCFVKAVSRYINEPLEILYRNVIQDYGSLAKTNVIAKFNLERLYLTEQNMVSCK